MINREQRSHVGMNNISDPSGVSASSRHDQLLIPPSTMLGKEYLGRPPGPSKDATGSSRFHYSTHPVAA